MTWTATNLEVGKHCFCGSEDGVSKGKYKGLNVNNFSLDNSADVLKNWQIAAEKVGLELKDLFLLRQGVSNKAVYADKALQNEVVADGIVTDKENIALCIRTADCVPILLEDKKNHIIGAAHAGWRGAFSGIIENVVALMIEKGAKKENIAAAIGPAIEQKSYEVDEKFYQLFLEQNKENSKYFVKGKKEGYYQFDLKTYDKDKLLNCGIKNIEVCKHDTYEMKEQYYSFRRFTHQNMVEKPKDFATEISLIRL